MTKIDITSGVVERGMDMAKDFLGKLIMPTVEEVGLLMKEQITIFRLKNQIKVLNKAQKIVEENNIKTRKISLKIALPLLEYSSVEEDEKLQDKWANLLSNLVDSEQNIQNHVFPFLLSQLSLSEFDALEKTYKMRNKRLDSTIIEMKEHSESIGNKLEVNIDRIDELQAERKELNLEDIDNYNSNISRIDQEIFRLDKENDDIIIKSENLATQFLSAEPILQDKLAAFELSNLTRLGLIMIQNELKKTSERIDIPVRARVNLARSFKVDTNVELETDHVLTELGILFIESCTVKKNVSS